MSQIVTRWILPDSAGVNVDCCPERGVQWSPLDYAILDSSRVKSPERIQWTPPDCVHRSPLEWELIPRFKLPYLGGTPLTKYYLLYYLSLIYYTYISMSILYINIIISNRRTLLKCTFTSVSDRDIKYISTLTYE